MSVKTVASRVDEAKALREQGLTFREIGERLGVSGVMAGKYTKGKTSANTRATKTYTSCRLRYNHSSVICQRTANHRGVHLSDTGGKLVYWD